MINFKIHKILLVILLQLIIHVQVDATCLKLVKEIGGDEKDNQFIRITGAHLTNDKDIYIIDSKGNFLARYNWQGDLVKRIGQYGQGPGDFSGPMYLNLYENKLYLWDMGNTRIVEMGLNLVEREFKYYKSHDGMPFMKNFFIIGKGKCVGNSISYSVDYKNEYRAIKLLDFKKQVSEMFFDRLPHKALKNPKTHTQQNIFFHFCPSFGVDMKNRQLLISFSYPNNPIDFYIYDFHGEYVDHFAYNFDENYRYPEYILKAQDRPPKKRTTIIVKSIFVYNGMYIVVISKNIFWDLREYDQENTALVFDAKSRKLIHRFSLPEFMRTLSVSENGYMLATKSYEETPKLYIYKLDL
jgi:hypothetical protein